MLYRFDMNGPRASVGCGILLLALGVILLTPLIDFLITLLGWALVVAGIFGIAAGALTWVFVSRRYRDI